MQLQSLRVVSARRRILLSIPDLRVDAKQLIGIEGPSGAGKSTLLLAIAGLLDAAEGQVLWGDVDLLQQTHRQRGDFRRRHMGIVFQDLYLFDEMDALANASLASRWARGDTASSIEARAADLLTGLGLDPDDRRPVERLSGGERQRVAVARALAVGPSILLADEPTACLDRINGAHLISALREQVDREGRTLIVASHDDALLETADRVVALRNGQIA